MTIHPSPAPSRPTKPLRARLLGCGLAASLGTALAAALAVGPAAAETLRCRSVNGNVTCAGSGAHSCQTVNGRTACTSGNGAVVQQFGQASRPTAPPPEPEAEDDPDEMLPDALPQPRRHPLQLERRGPAGQWLLLERDGSRLRLRTERLAIDRD